MRSARPNTTSMSCSITSNANSAGRPASRGDHGGGLVGTHAGRRFVEQQHQRLLQQRQADFELALGTVAETRHLVTQPVRQAKPRRVFLGLRAHRGEPRRTAPEHVPDAPFQRTREGQVFSHREAGEQVVALKRARQSGACAAVGRRAAQVRSSQKHAPGVGFQLAGDQVEQRRLAGAVRPDQAVDGSRRGAAAILRRSHAATRTTCAGPAPRNTSPLIAAPGSACAALRSATPAARTGHRGRRARRR